MQLYAGIHISDGKSVNPNDLHYLRNNILTLDPVKLALHWQEMGATYLHIVDLDAASMGYPVNEETIKDILDVVHIPAVSYTHLDVYKRQIYAGAGSGFLSDPGNPVYLLSLIHISIL